MDIGRCWVSHPGEWQPLFTLWQQRFPRQTRLHMWRQYGGAQVVGLTIGAPAAVAGEQLPAGAPRLLLATPHAHEPANTAAQVDVLSQLLQGCHLDGSAAELAPPADESGWLITFLPDTNSQGRLRSPVRCWDGSLYENDAFYKYAFGIAHDGERFGRYAEWDLHEHRPQMPGIEYEQVDEFTYVEPNTSRRSTHFRAIAELYSLYRYSHLLDMHQHEYDDAVLLPADFDDRSVDKQERIMTWANKLIRAWEAVGAAPRQTPSVPYRGQPRQQLFLRFWEGLCPGMLKITSEVRNNRHARTGEETPMERQFQTAAAAIRASLDYLRLF